MSATAHEFTVTVIMEARPASSPWLDYSWSAVGVTAQAAAQQRRDKQIIEHGEAMQHIYHGLSLQLHLDECESYYHNLMSPNPGCFIVAREEDGIPVPFLVSLSFDAVHAYQEGDDLVYAVPIPAELYHQVEAYVVEHYMPEKRSKRKRKNWKEAS